MIEETGRVIALHGELAEIEVVPRTACSNCSAASICSGTGTRTRRILANNRLHAGVGQTVVLQLNNRTAALSALAVFGIPAGLLLLGIIAGSLFLEDRLAAALGGLGLLSGLLIVGQINRSAHKRGRVLPTIVRIAEMKGDQSETDSLAAVSGADHDHGCQ